MTLTHEQRIKELEDVLRDERWGHEFDDIKASIEYHKEFDGNVMYESTFVRFQNGRRLEGE